MTFFSPLRATALAVALAATAFAASADTVTLKQVTSAQTGAEFVALGATELSAAQFRQRVLDKPMTDVTDKWTWIINSDGTSQSAAKDGSWATDNPWRMKGNLYCRTNEGKENCSKTYAIGAYLRFSKASDTDELATWTAKVD